MLKCEQNDQRFKILETRFRFSFGLSAAWSAAIDLGEKKKRFNVGESKIYGILF